MIDGGSSGESVGVHFLTPRTHSPCKFATPNETSQATKLQWKAPNDLSNPVHDSKHDLDAICGNHLQFYTHRSASHRTL